jgi:tRNA pseudouridine13 synthase
MLPPGKIKSCPEDFVVEELPAYEPSGAGDHLYIRFTKRDLTTDAAVRAIAGALDVRGRDIGIAGMKDKVAVTTQTVSVPVPPGDTGAIEARARALALDRITIHDARRHGNKLRTGHLAGNRFSLCIRGIPGGRVDEVVGALERLGKEGLPNAFGAQRFGRDKDNAERARAWLSGRERGPREPRMKRLLWSSLQSAMFNEVLRRRVEAGTWAIPLEGDLVKRRESGGLFLCTDVEVDRTRAAEGEICPTGPMFGVKMRAPEGAPLALEQSVLTEMLGDGVDLANTKPLGEGTRRALRLWIDELRIERDPPPKEPGTQEQGSSIRVYFVLPKGAYATTVIGTVVALEETSAGIDASASPEETTAEA